MFKRGIIIFICVAIVTAFGIYIKTTYFESGSYLVTQSIDPDHAYRLSVRGTDLRVYEFTPKSNPDQTCVFVAGEPKGGVDCFPKKGRKQ